MKALSLPFLLFLGLPVDQAQNKPMYTVRVTPTEFFSGALKRLEAHFDHSSAVCFNVRIQGGVTIWPDVEMWCDGKRVDRPRYGTKNDERSDEVTIVLREGERTDKDGKLYRVSVGGIESFVRDLKEPRSRQEIKVAFGPVSITEPLEFKPSVNSIVVWAMGAGDGIDLSKQGEIQKRLESLPWAMILRLRIGR